MFAIRTVAIEVCLLFNFAVVFDFNLCPVPPCKTQFIKKCPHDRQNAAIRSMVFFFLLYLAETEIREYCIRDDD